MKKFLAIMLALIMVLSLAACGEKQEAPAPETDTQQDHQDPEQPDQTFTSHISSGVSATAVAQWLVISS